MHNAQNSDGSGAAIFGNGWTNPFDAHMAYNAATNVLSVYDIDGARYDWSSNGSGGWIPPAGMQGTTLTPTSSNCGYQWTKKNGTIYIFWAPFAACGTAAGYYGRLSAIYERNWNNAITLTYNWTSNASTIENIASIQVANSDGHALTLTFATYGSYAELSAITRPDGIVSQGVVYDPAGLLG